MIVIITTAVAICIVVLLILCVPIGILYWIHMYRTMTDSKKPSPLQ